MKIKIYSFGKIKHQEIMGLLDHYLKLSSKYFDIEHIILKDVGERKIEFDDIKDKVTEVNIVMTEKGREMTSEGFAEYFKNKKMEGVDISIFFGNAYGVEIDTFDTFQKFSLSKMTMPHDLSLVVLLEQIFRAGSILAGSSYHK